MSIRYLTAKVAQQIDEELMSAVGAFSIDQLMELAGLACAQTLAKVYPRASHSRVLVCCGPGNQGGDGLVAARHLSQFGYNPTLFMPKPGNKDIYKRLQIQCNNMSIPTLPSSTNELAEALTTSDVILDAIFGFSFHPPVRAPFDTVLPLLAKSGKPIVSVDIPSGWDVEKGKIPVQGLEPDVLISLTAPKLGAKDFKGRHFLGGRFVSKSLEEKFELNLPEYPDYEQIVELPQNTAQKL
ncbi:YjeF N-terminal domain-like protein [Fomitiporia mediterranea MF3/22]|uniref:YjeF N-terminal domain-like protein n=1 Tax=Fomitiporia mediterranea (strain MF3/22) TaxID=694068 RepID=UPI00044080FD|nr:YjeF N-terminal domain-like protein [Fomitiporia mediterranea MF3/22]EJD07862.1 YjeF N-terminal domain-like protein [Fomitiporia mediterranea MF3/22]